MRTYRKPSERDLAIWAKVNEDLLDWLYTGLTGRFQIQGHQLIDKWSKELADKIVLEVGCGHGHHLRYGRNTYRSYVGLDIESKFLQTLQGRFSGTEVINGDAYNLPFKARTIDCVLSVYNFEHLKELPLCLKEINRVLKPEGELLVGLPTEGGVLYEIGRKLTSKRYMEKKYGIDYDAIVRWEHCNTFDDVVSMIKPLFKIDKIRFLPFSFFPTVHANVIGCLRASSRQ